MEQAVPPVFDCASCGAELRPRHSPPSGAQLICPQCGGAFHERVAGSAAEAPAKSSGNVNPYAAPFESSEPPREELDDAKVQLLAERLVKEKQDRTISLQLLITGLIGCFSPILAIYGTIFLLLRPQRYPGKAMAIAGTVLHWAWTVFLVILIALGAWG